MSAAPGARGDLVWGLVGRDWSISNPTAQGSSTDNWRWRLGGIGLRSAALLRRCCDLDEGARFRRAGTALAMVRASERMVSQLVGGDMAGMTPTQIQTQPPTRGPPRSGGGMKVDYTCPLAERLRPTTTAPGRNLTLVTLTPSRRRRRLSAVVTRTGGWSFVCLLWESRRT